MKIEIVESLSPTARAERFVNEGRTPPVPHNTVIDAEALAPETRAHLLQCAVEGGYGPPVLIEPGWCRAGLVTSPVRTVALTDGVLRLSDTVVERYGEIGGLAARIAAAAAFAPEALRLYAEARAAADAAAQLEQDRREAARAEYLRQQAEKDARKAAQKEAREAARLAWIAAYGSERLRLSVQIVGLDKALGVYRDERVEKLREVSGLPWERDLEESRHEEPRNPTLDDLRLCERVRANVSAWGLDASDESDVPELVFVRDGGEFTDEIAVLAMLDGMRVLIAPR